MVRRRKKQSRFGAYFIMGFMVFILVGSMLGVMLYAPPAPGNILYGDFEFVIDDAGYYTTEIDGRTYRFNNPPYSAASVPVSAEVIQLLQAPLMTVTFDPIQSELDLQYADAIRFELANTFTNLGGGMTQESELYSLPLITCADATKEIPVIQMDIGAPEIRAEEHCIHLVGNQTTLFLAKDALVYAYVGIIEPEPGLENE